MTRPRRIEFADAIYHVMSRGCGRQPIFHDASDYRRMLDGLQATVTRFGWIIYCFVLMPNHLHLLLQTPEPNLSKGMQALLSGFANWYVQRYQTVGHVFQGRYKSQLIEDESYFWTASRYIHLNPTRGRPPLVEHPREWHWSSFRGYDKRQYRLDWIAYSRLLDAWKGDQGGRKPEDAYRDFVEAGLQVPPDNPFRQAHSGWVIGSRAFVDRIKEQKQAERSDYLQPALRHLGSISLDIVLAEVVREFDTDLETLAQKRTQNPVRDIAALVARVKTSTPLRELALYFGLSHPDSVRALIVRAEKSLADSSELRRKLSRIEIALGKADAGTFRSCASTMADSSIPKRENRKLRNRIS